MNIHNDITFHDVQFDEQQYQQQQQYQQHQQQHSYLVSRVPQGGNPIQTPFRQLIQEFGCTGNTRGSKLISLVTQTAQKRETMTILHFNNQCVLHPRFIHGIHHLHFSIDLIGIEILDDDSISYGLLLEQDDIYYVCNRAQFTLNRSNHVMMWKSYSCSNLLANEFVPLVQQENSSNNNSSRLNFTKTGSSIRLGYITTSSTCKNKTQLISGIDNYIVRVRIGSDYSNSNNTDDQFNVSNLLMEQHEKVINLSEQIVRYCKQKSQDQSEQDELNRKLKMMESVYNRLRLSTSQLISSSSSAPQTTIHEEKYLDDDDFVEVTVVKNPIVSTPPPSTSYLDDLDSISTSSSISAVEGCDKLEFPDDDCITDGSEIEDINDHATTTTITTTTATIEDEEPVRFTATHSSPPQQPVRQSFITPTHRSMTLNDFIQSDDEEEDEWEMLADSKKTKFTKDKILHPNNEI
jgi:hypothetical protein